jgi:protein-disulfide isomerase
MAVPAFAEEKKAETPPAPSAPAAVQTEKIPDTSNIMFMENLRKAGATIHYLGDALGLHGWFAMKDGQVQIFYTTPDQRALLVGALLSAEGANISQQQIGLLANDKPEVMEALNKADAAPKAAPQAKEEVKPPSAEEFFAALEKADQVSFGKAEAPELVMIMDVNCEYCHRTWAKLEKPVNEGKLRVVMVPIAAMGAHSAQQGAVWLGSANPQDIWKKHVAGDKKVLEGTPVAGKQEAIVRNTQMVTRWKVDHTPYLLYRGGQGKIRLIVGEPKDANVILSDIGKSKN